MDFERLANRHKEAVYRQLVRLCGDYDDAEDALIEALLAAYKASATLRDEGSFQAWLAAIARRACLKIKRREALAPLLHVSDERLDRLHSDLGFQGDASIERQWVHDCIANALDGMPPIYREVYLKREIEGQEARRVAQELNLTLPAVKSRLLRAREMARIKLDSALCLGE